MGAELEFRIHLPPAQSQERTYRAYRWPAAALLRLEFAGRQLAVQALPVSDPDSTARVSREYLTKYQPSPYAQSMARAEVLPTTLRLEPR